ncbi:hypothetical protein LAC81_36760 (plasmid) [Ensifer adhaerens]|nr:hypothetical protein LAC78_38065 [Ensifer adhaerens]UAY05293.1 hypothetical protein LAC80_36775 [Ensifer adhaerens]UAY12671.1 hypothetical protein LAC81_36760 [Ensifer adhaerens]
MSVGFDGGVAIAVIDAEFADMMPMAEGNWLMLDPADERVIAAIGIAAKNPPMALQQK